MFLFIYIYLFIYLYLCFYLSLSIFLFIYLSTRSAAMGKRKSRIDRTIERAKEDGKITLPEQTYKRELQPDE